ncbi:MAG: hypothetical protein ACQET7_04450 [Thermodesulfobacteriota bacterium]
MPNANESCRAEIAIMNTRCLRRREAREFLRIEGIEAMGGLGIFGLRLLVSVVLSLVISRLFFGNISIVRVGGLALALLVFAYVLEYTKKRDKGDENGI